MLLNEMIVLDIRHIAATLLHPCYRCLKKIPDFMKDQCYKYVRHQTRQLREKVEVEEINQQQLTEPPKKKFNSGRNISRFESGNLTENINDHEENSNESDEFEFDLRKRDELDRYLLFEFDKNKEITHPLQFWKNHANKFPLLSRYTRSLLSMPATTVSVEREFSAAGWILNKQRSHLQPNKLENILLVRSKEKNSFLK